MSKSTLLVFGDLHGRILPAIRLATVWSRELLTPLAGLLHVGDLGYFPDQTRLDKATLRHAQDEPTELGAQDIVLANSLADSVFNAPECPPGLWFTAGNHEDHDALVSLSQSSGRGDDFAVDAYDQVRCIKDGRCVRFRDGPSVGAIWGIDGVGKNSRKRLPSRAYIDSRAIDRLLTQPIDVLLTHDAPLDAKRAGYGSELIASLIQLAKPKFAFFGHYHGEGSRIDGGFGATEVYHLGGMELKGRNGHAEFGSVGALTWAGDSGRFEFLDEQWLRTFTRHNWKWR